MFLQRIDIARLFILSSVMTFLRFRVGLVFPLVFFAPVVARPAADPASSPTTHPTTIPAAASLFDYDRSAPLHVEQIAEEIRGDARVRDITFVARKNPIK